MAAKIRKNDLVEVVRGRTSDEKALAKRNARRAEEGLEPLKPGDKGKQGKVLRVFPTDERVLVEGVNRVTKHLRAGQDNNGSTEGGLQVVEAPIHISNVAVVDPETKKPTRVGYRFETVEKDGVSKTVKVRFAKASGKEL